jgi:hypothetical protein
MNNLTKLSIFSLVICVLLASCSSTKKISEVTKAVELKLPLSQYKSDSKSLRVVQSGNSPDLAFAKKIALENANAEMAGYINVTIKDVLKQYVKQEVVANTIEFGKNIEDYSQQIVDQSMSGVRVLEEKIFQESDKTYTYWVATELSKEDSFNKISQKISKDKKVKLGIDEDKFREEFYKALEQNDKNK